MQLRSEGDDPIAHVEDDPPVEPPTGHILQDGKAAEVIAAEILSRLDLDPDDPAIDLQDDIHLRALLAPEMKHLRPLHMPGDLLHQFHRHEILEQPAKQLSIDFQAFPGQPPIRIIEFPTAMAAVA